MEDFENDQEETLSVVDMEGYIEHLATFLCKEFAPQATSKDVYVFCSPKQIESIIHDSCLGFDENDNPIINAKIYAQICDSIFRTVQNASLSKLASDGYLECAWDDDLNDMVFWLPDEPK
jgi:hypothetical protein